jgi:hypothetical protein
VKPPKGFVWASFVNGERERTAQQQWASSSCSSQNNVGAEFVNDNNDFPKFDDFLKQSLSFQHFRP